MGGVSWSWVSGAPPARHPQAPKEQLRLVGKDRGRRPMCKATQEIRADLDEVCTVVGTYEVKPFVHTEGSVRSTVYLAVTAKASPASIFAQHTTAGRSPTGVNFAVSAALIATCVS